MKVVTIKSNRNGVATPAARNDRRLCDNKVFVGRHRALYDYCRQIGLIGHGTPCLRRVRIPDIKGRDVVGSLPLELASYAKTYTEIPLKCHVPPGEELSIEDIKMGALSPRTYKVERID